MADGAALRVSRARRRLALVARGLRMRVAGFLALALLPVGLILMLQMSEYRAEAERRMTLGLVALTTQAAVPEQQVIERALGVAEALSLVIGRFSDADDCTDYLQRFVGPEASFAFVGLVQQDGSIGCSSLGVLSPMIGAEFAATTPRDRPTLAWRQVEGADRKQYLILSLPVVQGPEFVGFLALALRQERITPQVFGRVAGPEGGHAMDPMDNPVSDVVADAMPDPVAEARLPATEDPAAPAGAASLADPGAMARPSNDLPPAPGSVGIAGLPRASGGLGAEAIAPLTEASGADGAAIPAADLDVPLALAALPAVVQPAPNGLRALALIDATGQVLSVSVLPDRDRRGPEDAEAAPQGGSPAALAALQRLLPPGLDAAGIAAFGPLTEVEGADGHARSLILTPLVPGLIQVLGVWDRQHPKALLGLPEGPAPWVAPVILWFICLLVAFAVMHRLVIRHVRRLALRMRSFGRDRSLPSEAVSRSVPLELLEIDTAFRAMAADITRDEAAMAERLRERDVLLREVHHRVKNNLQLILSIIAMQSRRSRTDEARHCLSRLSDRILGLAAVYRSLYRSDDLAEVEAAGLLRDVAGQIGRDPGCPEVALDLDEVMLVPDQAAPLALLLAEALSNAVGICSLRRVQRPILVSLRQIGAEEAEFSITNGLPAPEAHDEAAPGAFATQGGLGLSLIRAFAAQLGSSAKIDVAEGSYRISVRFAARRAGADRPAPAAATSSEGGDPLPATP